MHLNKFILLFLLISFFFDVLKSEASQFPPITEIQLTQGDTVYRRLYIYNEAGQKSVETRYVKIAQAWLRRQQIEWLYDHGKCVEQRLRQWKNDHWELTNRIELQYVGDRLKSETYYTTIAEAEVARSKTEYAYSDNGLTEQTDFRNEKGVWRETFKSQRHYATATGQKPQQVLLHATGSMQPQSSKLTYTYTSTGQLKSILCQEKSEQGWNNTAKTSYYYSPDGNLLIAELTKHWDGQSNQWINLRCTEYSYDHTGHIQEEIFLKWKDFFWQKELKYTYAYNADGLLLQKTIHLPIFKHFRPAWSICYSDFKYGKPSLIEAKNEFWGGESGASFNTFIPYRFNNEMAVDYANRISISYIPVFDTELSRPPSNGVDNNTIVIYPNPSEGIFYFDNEKCGVTRWTVSELNGKNILREKKGRDRSGVIDLSDLRTGIYLLRAFTPNGVKVQRLIKK